MFKLPFMFIRKLYESEDKKIGSLRFF